MTLPVISTNPDVMVGKPCVAGTRVTVELILERLAHGFTPAQIHTSYPHLPAGSVAAAVNYSLPADNNNTTEEMSVCVL